MIVIHLDWGSKQSANAAAKVIGTLAHLMGHVTLEFTDVSLETLQYFTAPFYVEKAYRSGFQCNDEGEYTADGSFNEEQIRVSGLMDQVRYVLSIDDFINPIQF